MELFTVIASVVPLAAVDISFFVSLNAPPSIVVIGSLVLALDDKLFFLAFSFSFIPIFATANVDIFLLSFFVSVFIEMDVLWKKIDLYRCVFRQQFR